MSTLPWALNSPAPAVIATSVTVKTAGRHLAGDEPRVDQLVEPELVVAELALDLLGRERQVGGPDGLVGLLRVLAGGVADRLGRQVASRRTRS